VEKYYPKAADFPGQMPTFELSSRHGGAATGAAPARNLTEDIKRLDALAVAPGVLDKLLELAKPGTVDLKAAMQVAASDPALAGWILAVANTPAFGLSSQVDSLGLSVALLGQEGLAASVAQLKKEAPQPRADFGAAYDSARKASLAAALLAKKSGKVDRGSAYTAALLRRIGWFALATVAPNDIQAIDMTLDEAARCEEERKRFGITHLEAGAITGSRWRLPETLLTVVSAPEGDASTGLLPAVAMLACAIAERGEREGAACFSGLDKQLSALGLDTATAFAEAKKVFEG
jgi:HD-like signal output (HDOD) protein